MKISEIYNKLNEYAPVMLSDAFCDTYEEYDNSGIILSTNEDIDKVVFSLDLTKTALKKAESIGAKLIVTHHPALYVPMETRTNAEIIDSLDDTALLSKCKKLGIGVISFHLNLDVAKTGIDYYLAKGFGMEDKSEYLMPITSEIGYGRIFSVNKKYQDIIEDYFKTFNTDKAFIYGDRNKNIKKVATLCGAGYGSQEIDLIGGADLIASSDIPHHVILETIEKGKCLMIIPHYTSEIYGFSFFYEWLKNNTDLKCTLNVEKKYL